MVAAGIDAGQIGTCMADSGGEKRPRGVYGDIGTVVLSANAGPAAKPLPPTAPLSLGTLTGTTSDTVNQLLQSEITAKDEKGVIVVPTVYVNTVAMRGGISDQTVFSTICSGFLDGTSPEVRGGIERGECGARWREGAEKDALDGEGAD